MLNQDPLLLRLTPNSLSQEALSLVNLALTVVRSVNVHRAKIQFSRLIDPAHAKRQPDVLKG